MTAFTIAICAESIAYKGDAYFGADEYGLGVESLEEAEEQLLSYARQKMSRLSPTMRAAKIYTGRFVGRVRIPCRVCGVRGIKPGCKKKKCLACAEWCAIAFIDLICDVGQS